MPFIQLKQVKDLLASITAKLDDSQLNTTTTLGVSDLDIASQNAIKTYVDDKTVNLPSIMNYKGAFDVSGASFDDISPAEEGDLYKIVGIATIDGIQLDNGDMVVVNTTIATVTGTDVTKIDNTETADLMHETTQLINDDTFTAVTDSTVPSADSVKNYTDGLVNTIKKDAFTEHSEEFTPGSNITAGTDFPIALAFQSAIGNTVDVFVNGVTLDSGEYTHTVGTNLVTVNLEYLLETTDVIKITYEYN